jgi:hypothetical protein
MPRLEDFYHGTSANIPVGSKIVPGKTIGTDYSKDEKSIRRQKTSDLVFTTQNENVAWDYAHAAALASGGRAKVYGVNPSPNAQPGLFNSMHKNFRGSNREDLAEYASSSATVHTQHDIMPGRQGTLPINWHQFGGDTPYGVMNVNHPTPGEVEHGHPGSNMYGEYLRNSSSEINLDSPQKETLF